MPTAVLVVLVVVSLAAVFACALVVLAVRRSPTAVGQSPDVAVRSESRGRRATRKG